MGGKFQKHFILFFQSQDTKIYQLFQSRYALEDETFKN